MRRQRATNRPMASINVVPYIDVMLVLLIIFMAATPLINQGIEVALPKISKDSVSSVDTKEQIYTASIDAAGRFYFNNGDNSKTHLEDRELKDKVLAVLKINPSPTVLLRGDKNVKYDDFIQLMSRLRSYGVIKFSFELQSSDGG